MYIAVWCKMLSKRPICSAHNDDPRAILGVRLEPVSDFHVVMLMDFAYICKTNSIKRE